MVKIEVQLMIQQNQQGKHEYQYFSILNGGVVVETNSFVIGKNTEFDIELTPVTESNYFITQCLVPGHQSTVKVTEIDKERVIVSDIDVKGKPHDYNFIIIAEHKETHERVICDPQIRNKKKY